MVYYHPLHLLKEKIYLTIHIYSNNVYIDKKLNEHNIKLKQILNFVYNFNLILPLNVVLLVKQIIKYAYMYSMSSMTF